INMRTGMDNQKAAVESGPWPLYRFDPRRAAQGLNPLQLDSRAPKIPLKVYAEMENRFKMLMKSHPERAATLLKKAQEAATNRYQEYARRAQPYDKPKSETKPNAESTPAPAATSS
ncbi:MAG: hypothetical protein WBE26_06320, partial [Phycisphaerae bacterium]